MTKQTKPIQIGLVCFAFKLLRSVQETRHRRNGSTYFFSEGSMARSLIVLTFLPARCSPAKAPFPAALT